MTDARTPNFNPGKGLGQPVGVAILGFGTVGSQVFRYLQENGEELKQRVGGPLVVRGIAVGSVEKHRDDVPSELLTDDAPSLIAREDVDVVVEVIGGIEYPRVLVLQALNSGKSVVTANKALVAAHADELAAAADANNVDLWFEAAVAGAIPVVGPLRRSLAGDQVNWVAGIVNGTTNYILDAMDSTGADYHQALAEATELGYAEADPTADVEGYDAASKAAILASLAFHTRVTADDVYREGITKVTPSDIKAAQAANQVIKLLAICEKITDEDGVDKVAARVHPTLLDRSHPLASVNKSFNAIFVDCEAAGKLMFYGNGAGGSPTASAVLGDLVGASRNKVHGGRAPGESTYANLPVAPFDSVSTRYHIDMRVKDRVGVLSEITAIFARHGISIRTVRQVEQGDHARLIVVTHSALEHDLRATVEELNRDDSVQEVTSVLYLESLGE